MFMWYGCSWKSLFLIGMLVMVFSSYGYFQILMVVYLCVVWWNGLPNQDNVNTQLEWVPQNIRELNREVDKLKKTWPWDPCTKCMRKNITDFYFKTKKSIWKEFMLGFKYKHCRRKFKRKCSESLKIYVTNSTWQSMLQRLPKNGWHTKKL